MENPTLDLPNQGRPRSKSTFSFRSQNSDKSGITKPKIKMDLTETPEEKRKSRFSGKSKVNPNRALNEPQPMFEALEKPTLPQLRSGQFRDIYGNMIMDPDKTNPTRHRLERPLDTIRAFEAAIDNGHKRRSQAVRAESADAVPGFSSRRPSTQYSSMSEIPHFAPRYSPASAYTPSRHSSYRGNYEPSSYGQFPQKRSMPYRSITSPPPPHHRLSFNHSVYNSPVYHESHDTVNTAAESSGSQSTEPLGYSTDPSSENSSIDRVHAVRHMDSGDAYGGAQYGRGSPMHLPIQEEHWQDGRFQPQDSYEQSPMPQQTFRRPSGPQQAPAPTRQSMPQQFQAPTQPFVPQQAQVPARTQPTQAQALPRTQQVQAPPAPRAQQVQAQAQAPPRMQQLQAPVPPPKQPAQAQSTARVQQTQTQGPPRTQQAQAPARPAVLKQPSARQPAAQPPPSSYRQAQVQRQNTQSAGAVGQGAQAKNPYGGAAMAAAALAANGAQQQTDKQKGWLKRRFSSKIA